MFKGKRHIEDLQTLEGWEIHQSFYKYDIRRMAIGEK